MSTIKINELASSAISLTDFFAKADASGVANKNTVQGLSNFLNTVGTLAFRGVLLAADAAVTQDGIYVAGDAGTYTNNGGLVITVNDKIVLISITGTQTVFEQAIFPITLTIDAIPTEGSINAVESDGVLKKILLEVDTEVPSKLTLDILYTNLYDPNDRNIIDGGYYNATGVFVSNDSYVSSGFIKCEATETFTASYIDAFVTWWDINRDFLGSTTSTDFSNNKFVTAPAGAKYGRFLYFKGISRGVNNDLYYRIVKNQVAVLSGSNLISPIYYKYKALLNINSLNVENKNIQFNEIKAEKLDIFNTSKNLFNINDSTNIIGGYYNQNGAFVSSADYNQTGFLKITELLNYTASYVSAFVLWYDENKEYLSDTSSTDFLNNGFATAPLSAYYGKFISTVSLWELFQVEQANTQTVFEPYILNVKSEIVNSGLISREFVSYGDSITYQNLWQPSIASYFNLNHTPQGIGSTTLALVPEFEAEYPSFTNATRISNLQALNPSVVTIFGGANDYARGVPIGTDSEFALAINSKNKENFKGAYSWIIETLLNWKPTLKIIILGTTRSSSYDYYNYSDACKDVAKYYALPFVDLNNESGISKFNTSLSAPDGIHPSEWSAKNISNAVISKMKDLYNI